LEDAIFVLKLLEFDHMLAKWGQQGLHRPFGGIYHEISEI
jgi:hypothetical protein